MKKNSIPVIILFCLMLLLVSCANDDSPADSQELTVLPPPEPDGGPFGVDVNINMNTIDNYLGRPDVAYVDVRMLYDPADFEAIGGDSTLSRTLPGYRIAPLPYIATLSAMPVGNAYDGVKLFDVVWGENGGITSISANYAESSIILDELFPKDKIIFLMCGGAGYSSLVRALLIHQGWDESRIYHTGGNWHYEGDKSLDLTISSTNRNIATWRANYAFIDFEHLTPIN